MKTILLASRHDFPPYSRGGGELCAAELLTAIRDFHQASVLVLSCPAHVRKRETYSFRGIPVWRLPSTDFDAALERAVIRYRPDGLLTYLEGTAAVAAYGARVGIKTGLLIVDTGGVWEGLASFPMRPAVIVCISRFLQRMTRSAFRATACCFPPPLMKENVGVQTHWRRPQSDTIGMVNPNQLKGGLLLNKLANMLPDSRFLVTKGWSYVEAAPACSLESPNIRRMEWSPDVDAFYSQISLLLIPSLCCEGFGRVAREAILRGIPVVASNRGALRESACDTGVFLNPTSPAIWKRAILRILSDRTEYDRLSRRGFYAARATEARDRVARTRAIAAIRTAFGVRSGQ